MRRLVTGQWTRAEADTLRALAPNLCVLEIATRLSREWRSVKEYAAKHAIPVFDNPRLSHTAQIIPLSDKWNKREDTKLEVYRLRIYEHKNWAQIARIINLSTKQAQNLFDEACQDAIQRRPDEMVALHREQQEAITLIQDTFIDVVKEYRNTQNPELFVAAVDAAKTYLNAHDRLARLCFLGVSGKKDQTTNVLVLQSSETELQQFAQRLRAESMALEHIVDGEIVSPRDSPSQRPKDQPPPTDSSDDVAIPDV